MVLIHANSDSARKSKESELDIELQAAKKEIETLKKEVRKLQSKKIRFLVGFCNYII